MSPRSRRFIVGHVWPAPAVARIMGRGTDRLGGVLFDMDGTLVDSEKVWSVGLDELAAHLGGALSAAARHAMVGTNMAQSMRILHDDLGVDADPPESLRWLEERV